MGGYKSDADLLLCMELRLVTLGEWKDLLEQVQVGERLK